MPEIFKNSSKTGDQFTAISDLHNNVERVLLQVGNRHSVEGFQNEFIVPRYLRHSCLKGQGYFCFSVKNS